MAERQYMKAYGFDKMQEALKSLDLEENKVNCLAMMNKIGQVVKDSTIASLALIKITKSPYRSKTKKRNNGSLALIKITKSPYRTTMRILS